MSNDVVKYEPKAPAKTQSTLKAILNGPKMLEAFAEVVPKHLDADRIVKMALIATSRQPKLLECTQESLLKAVMTSTELGLDCSGTLGRAYLVPFRNNKAGTTEALFIPGYLGLMDLARRSGEIESISAEVVYKSDTFKYEKGLEDKLIHAPDIEGEENDSDIIGAYMVARFRGGGHHVEYMSRKQIEKIRAISKAKDSGPWRDHYAAMCRKTVIRRGLKFCPLSIEAQDLIAKTDTEFDFNEKPTVTLEPTEGRQKFGFTTEMKIPESGPPVPEIETPDEPPPPEESEKRGPGRPRTAGIKKKIAFMEALMTDKELSDNQKQEIRNACYNFFRIESRADLTDDNLGEFKKWLDDEFISMVNEMTKE